MSDLTERELRKKREREELRDWFAGQALAGLLATQAHPENVKATMRKYSNDAEGSRQMRADMAQGAYLIADAMLAERSKQEGA